DWSTSGRARSGTTSTSSRCSQRETAGGRSEAHGIRGVRRIGIDVGGTNTDAVLLDGERVLHAVKTPTTGDVTTGITRALDLLLDARSAQPRTPEDDQSVKHDQSARGTQPPTTLNRPPSVRAGPAAPATVDAAMIGTTHFTNTVVQRKGVGAVAAIRIGLPASASLEPFIDWPDDLAAIVRGEIFMLEGGHEYDGRPIVPFDAAGMRRAARRIRELGLRSVAIASVFSPLNASCEDQAAAILRDECPGVTITLSHHLGRIGLLERENVTLLNAALADLAERTVGAFVEALRRSGIAAPLYLTQNDGTVMLASLAQRYPVYSFASGPTNSMRGAAF